MNCNCCGQDTMKRIGIIRHDGVLREQHWCTNCGTWASVNVVGETCQWSVPRSLFIVASKEKVTDEIVRE